MSPLTEENGGNKLNKKIKQYPEENQSGSKLFQPFKAVGYICNQVPFSLQTLGDATFIATSVGNSFHIYDLTKLNVVMVGRQNDKPINAISLRREFTFVAIGNQIIKYKRTHQVKIMESSTSGDIFALQIFGSHIIALTEDNSFQLYEISSGELYTSIEFSDNFRVTCVVHPDTYLNKVIFGSAQGSMQLWNIKTRKLIYSFRPFSSPITCIVQSPIVDVLAIGLLDGTIILYNVKLDKKLFSFKQENKVTSISFRTDSVHHMATASMDGDIAIWDLENKRLFHNMKFAHTGNIPSIQFINNQPLLISSGTDNSLKQWLFDTHDGIPRLLKSRAGHFEAPSQIKYYFGGTVLSAGQDNTLRQFSVFKDNRAAELSQGHLESQAKKHDTDINDLRLPPITNFAIHNAKQKRWDNILTVHLGQPAVRSWSLQRMALGKHILTPPNQEISKVVAISHCGNFGLIGTLQGRIHMFNIESGLLRKSTSKGQSHKSTITSILTDSSNRIFTTTSLDGKVKVWNFNSFSCEYTIETDSSISSAISHKDNTLIAIASDDFNIKIVDIETQKIARILDGHTHRITAMAFSPDGRWILSSGLDSTVRTWDIPTGHMVDIFSVPNVVTGLDFSPYGDFLATTHSNEVGIFIWSNRIMYSDITLRSIPTSFVPNQIVLPSTAIEEINENEESNAIEEKEDDKEDDKDNENTLYRSPDQITSDMVTLSNQPWSKWQKLLNLETIKLRNKPIAPPKKPELAPFFLSTTQGVNPQFIANTKNEDLEEENSKILTSFDNIESELIIIMKEAFQSQQVENLLSAMESLMPPQIEVEVTILSVSNNFEQFKIFLNGIILLLEKRVGFEMAHAYLNTFLKHHGDLIHENSEVFKEQLGKLKQVHKHQWDHLATLFQFTTQMVNFVKNQNV